jgi:putative membrane protein
MNLPLVPLFADDPPDILMHEKFWHGFISSALFGLLGICLILLAFKMFDWLTPRIDIQMELAEKKNTAVAVVVAAVIVGMCYLMSVAIH